LLLYKKQIRVDTGNIDYILNMLYTFSKYPSHVVVRMQQLDNNDAIEIAEIIEIVEVVEIADVDSSVEPQQR